tara:strand:+ start:275 stop:1264 length:990 start_codon:yes stop_codon:yes gene_type:complete
MAEFSYGDDIAPMKGEYFGMRPVSTRMSEYLYEQYDRPMMQMQAERRKVQAQDLAFQRAQLEFDKAKEDSRRQQEEADHLAVVSAQLSEGLNSDMSNFDKVNLINQTRQDLYTSKPRLAGSPLFKGLFTSATQSVAGSEAQQDYYIPQMTAVSSLGDVETAERLANSDGILTEKEKGLIEVTRAHAKALSGKTGAGRADKRLNAEIDRIKSNIAIVRRLGDEVAAEPETDEEREEYDPNVQQESKLRLYKGQVQQMSGIAESHLTGKALEQYRDADHFHDVGSRKNYLINQLMLKEKQMLDELYGPSSFVSPERKLQQEDAASRMDPNR